MPESIRYADMAFDPEFLFAIDSAGREIRFSRAERSLLAKFAANPKTVLSRDRLLDAISGPGSDASDRNIDFVINRLRRKLGDWRAGRCSSPPSTAKAMCGSPSVLRSRRFWPAPFSSSVRFAGLAMSAASPIGRAAWAQELRRRLARQLDGNKRVELDETCPSAQDFVGDKPQFALDLTFVVVDGRLDCAVTLKDFASGQVVHVSRQAVAAGEAPVDHEAIEGLGGDIISAIWDRLAYRASTSQAPADPPLALRMHAATQLLGNVESWVESEKRMRARLAENPEDHQAQLLLAVALHSKYVQTFMITPGNDTRAADEDEMEWLVLVRPAASPGQSGLRHDRGQAALFPRPLATGRWRSISSSRPSGNHGAGDVLRHPRSDPHVPGPVRRGAVALRSGHRAIRGRLGIPHLSSGDEVPGADRRRRSRKPRPGDGGTLRQEGGTPARHSPSSSPLPRLPGPPPRRA